MPVNIQLSKISIASAISRSPILCKLPNSEWWARVDLNHRPHPYQGCALASLSYGPKLAILVELVGIEPATS